MKPGIPWSVKGIEPDTREAAKNAARRSGMTLGEWLNAAIVEQAEPEPVSEHRKPSATKLNPAHSKISTHPIERAATRLEDIAEQLSRIAQRESGMSSTRYIPQAEQDDQPALARVLGRLESNERQTVEAFTAVNERLSVLGRQFAKIQATPQQKPEESPGYQTLEKAVRNIIEHLEVSEKRTRENLKTLQERMGDMSARVNGAGSEQILKQAPAFSQLESRLSELARRVETSQQPSHDLPQVLRHELDGLAARIDDVRETAENLAGKAQTQAVQQAQNELRVIEGRILGLLREAQNSIAAQATGPADLNRIRNEIDQLHSRIDEAHRASASDQDVSALRQVVEQLSTRVAQGQDTRPFVEMDRKIVDLSKRLEQTQAATRDMPQFNELERRMAELDHRLSEAMRLQGEGPARELLEQKLAEVDDRLGRTEHQLKHLETIERAISQLYDSIEHGRSHATQAAEDAANRMAQTIMAQGPQSVSLAGSPEIMALEQGLQAVREASQSADARNQETLEAVHETLEQIVHKLAELETAAIGQRVAQATGVTQQATQAPSPAPAPQPPEAAAEFDPFASRLSPEPAMSPANPFGNLMPNDAGTRPGSNPFAAPSAEAISPNEDFIALARRVAQSASSANHALVSPQANDGRGGKAGKPKRGFTLPFKHGSKAEAEPSLNPGEIKLPPIKAANSNATSRRKLAIMGLVLLAMVAGISVNMLGRMRSAPPAEPTPIAVPADPQMDQKPADPAAAPPAAATAPAAPAAAAPPGSAAPPGASDQKPGQQSENIDPNQGDPILTGALSAAPAMATPGPLETTIGSTSLRDAAMAGDGQAQFVVATRYLNGENVAQDYAKAAYWYGKASATGLAPAQYRMATLYERGKGVNLDLKSALSWYERAAALGNVKAMHNAAVLAAGTGAGAPDYAKAFNWFSLAAAHGLKDSEFNLAVLIERGLGTKADPTQAYFWYLAAAAQGDNDAQTRADQLAKTLSIATVDATKTRLKNWTPDKAPDNANVVSIDESRWQPNSTPRVQSASATPQDATPPKDMIVGAQDLLEKLGYNIGPHDGKLEGKTANAVRLFQLQKGMTVTGKVTPELMVALHAAIS